MSDNKSALDVDLVNNLKMARDRLGISDDADLVWLAEGDNLLKVRCVRLGGAKIVSKTGLSVPTFVTLPAVQPLGRLVGHENVWLSACATKLFDSVGKFSQIIKERTLEGRVLFGSSTDFKSVKKQLGAGDAIVFDSVEDIETVILQLKVTPACDSFAGLLFDTDPVIILFVRDPLNANRMSCVSLKWSVQFSRLYIDCTDASGCRWPAGRIIFRPAATQESNL